MAESTTASPRRRPLAPKLQTGGRTSSAINLKTAVSAVGMQKMLAMQRAKKQFASHASKEIGPGHSADQEKNDADINMQAMSEMEKIRAKAYNRLTDEQITVLTEEFKIFDKDGSGQISKSEFASIMRSLSVYNSTEAEEAGIDSLFLAIDADGDARLNLKEFLTMIAIGMYDDFTKQELVNAFMGFDLDGDGTVTMSELKKCLGSLGPKHITMREIEELMALVDDDGSGNFKIDEFLKYFGQDASAAPSK